jgi:hypothetical protein
MRLPGNARFVRLVIAVTSACVGVAACAPEGPSPTRRRANSGQYAADEIVYVPRTPELPNYPCGEQCHDDRVPDPRPRELVEFHTLKVLDHGPGMRWCDSCHAIRDIDHLRLFDGTPVSFDESFHLCGQCHGDRLRDFHNGTHGFSGGRWSERIERRNCTACHDPHKPRPYRLEALPPPQRRDAEGGH